MERDAAWMYVAAGLVREPGLDRRVGGGSMGFGSWTDHPSLSVLDSQDSRTPHCLLVHLIHGRGGSVEPTVIVFCLAN